MWLRFGECLNSLGEPTGAAEAYATVVKLAPSHSGARVILSTLQQQLGRHEEALEALEHGERPKISPLLRHLKPATGRPYVPAFSFSGTVPAFTCDCLRFVCAFTQRRKFDLCVSTSLRTMLAFRNKVIFSSSACSTPAFCRR